MKRTRTRILLAAALALLIGTGVAVAPSATASLHWPWGNDRHALSTLEVQSLDGSGNNRTHADWGKAGNAYSRVARANYADGRSAPVAGPNSRLISNRIFNDANQNVFSENRVTQWGWTWGQFLDHTFGLRNDAGSASPIAFDPTDPLESFTNTLGAIPFNRSAAAPGTGKSNPRQQINTIASFIDASDVYGSTPDREEWLRDGPFDGNLANNKATLMLPGGMLPRRDTRGNVASAPGMDVDGRLLAAPATAAVAGDRRANENIALTATQTLFAREHNRIVGLLPNSLTEEQKFQIARRVVIAEQQYITYHEFLPAFGVNLPTYRGYNPRVDTDLSNEFATVGYRAHSQIHGEFEIDADASRYSAGVLTSLKSEGVEVLPGEEADELSLAIPLGVAFFNPDLLTQVQLGPMLQALGAESEYNNDEQIDNQLRSTLFQVPVQGNGDCLDGPDLPQCFTGVNDLAALDIERGRDHGMPSYNDLRRAYGLPPAFSFTDITGEKTEAFPADTALTPGKEINDPHSLDVMSLSGVDGKPIALGTDAAANDAIHEVRRTTVAARLKAIYGTPDKVDAFVGMAAEPHVAGSELGALQQAMWRKQFAALRDGDRFFYGNDPGLSVIQRTLGIDFRHSLGDIIALNTDIPRADLAKDVFVLPATKAAPGSTTPAPGGRSSAQPGGGGGGVPTAPSPSTVPPVTPPNKQN